MPKLDFRYLKDFISEEEFAAKALKAEEAHRTLMTKSGAGSDFTGFVELPEEYDREEFSRILSAAEKIRNQSEVLIVIGIGGSYLGARAVIELATSPLRNRIHRNGPEVYFAGCNLSPDYMAEIAEICEEKDFSVNVISKSGTTTEPAIAFRFFRNLLEKKYGREEAKERIYCTTDRARGTLKALADKEGWETFVVPDDIGGRFSVLTPVGLLPIAAAGIDINELMAGAAEAKAEYQNPNFAENEAMQYAAARNILLEKGKALELLVSYEPAFSQMAEWWKQLFGESEGKDGKGIFPCSAIFSMDLHSLGQFVQDGSRNLFETVVRFEKAQKKLAVALDEENSDGLNFLAGMDMQEINEKARLGTLVAHTEGGAPNIVITCEERNPKEIGKLIYFFEIAVAVSGYMLGVNPFNQPGVESYKKNMFALLGKPGYEDMKAAIEVKLD
ncbi:MAG: glucose-6-phosphate isomerase [Oscillospiraceae bacterium]|nr:glucose-6-phosphate isomerase [Oscillospiraceae bacterium]